MLPEDAAKQILATFVHTHGQGAGGTLFTHDLAPFFQTAPWKGEDCGIGIKYAIDQGWIEPCGIGHFVLTDAGARAASPSHLDRGPVSWVR